MTDKQSNILASGLELFATKGYHATSTNEVAKLAGVSEALIFRHFINKEGLLTAILKEGETKVEIMYRQIMIQTDPKKLIMEFIKLPFIVPESEYNFWRLLYTLKWEIKAEHTQKAKPLKAALTNAFKELGFVKPAMEADHIMFYSEGLIAAILKGEIKADNGLKNFLFDKYIIKVKPLLKIIP